MTAGEKTIFGVSVDQFHADLAAESAAEHEQASRTLNSWLKYLSVEEIRGLVATAEIAAKAEIARRQGAQDA